MITVENERIFDRDEGARRVHGLLGDDSLPSGFSGAELAAAGGLLDYIDRTQKGQIPYIAPPQKMVAGGVMEIDAAARRNLELVRSQSGGESRAQARKGSLLHAIDRTVSSAGSRALQQRLSAPLLDIPEITCRQDEIAVFLDHQNARDAFRMMLRQMPDMARALGRLSVERGGPRDLAALRNGLVEAEKARCNLAVLLGTYPALERLSRGTHFPPDLEELADQLNMKLVDEPPVLARDGGFIKSGVDLRLDELRNMRMESRRALANLQAEYTKLTGVENLKISYNNVLGYYIEVPSKKANGLMVSPSQDPDSEIARNNPFIHRQTLANVMRFTTPALAELERDMSGAEEKALALEEDLFEDLKEFALDNAQAIGDIAQTMADLDIACALADLAEDHEYCRPEITNDTGFDIISGRHPVVEQVLKEQGGESFIPNDCAMGAESRLWLLTGPNMAGKSTYLRQNALIAILAQIGSYVPAKSAKIGLVDKIFSRVGASDDLARGQSTFMVEMVETAAILSQATPNSLVILDEIGRGTATFDGLSIAWAVLEYLHEKIGCRAFFATHYHELTMLQSRLTSMVCHSMQVTEWKGEIVFTHKIGPGAANRSYGIHVARLAGLPKIVTARAQDILERLQNGGEDKAQAPENLPENSPENFNDKAGPSHIGASLAGLIGAEGEALPLFSELSPELSEDEIAQDGENSGAGAILPDDLGGDLGDSLRDALAGIDPDDLTPKQALDALYRLKALED